MSYIDPGVISGAIAGAVALASLVYTGRQTRSAALATHKIEERKVDAEAFRLAKEFYETANTALRLEVERLEGVVARLRADLDCLRSECEIERASARARVEEVERILGRVKRLLESVEPAMLPAELQKIMKEE